MKKIVFVFFSVLLFFGLISCNSNPNLKVGEGNLPVKGGKVWYEVSGSRGGIPLVLIHGGPGISSYYMKPFEELGNDRQVIRYDQFGSGKSTYTEDTTFYTLEQRVLELDSLRKALGIKKWNVLGHSLGTIIALEYYHTFPENVASLIFEGACFDIPAYAENVSLLLKTLPDSLQKAVAYSDSTNNYMNPLYQEAIDQFNNLYILRYPDKINMDSVWANFNATIYNYIQGPSEFTITGVIKNLNNTQYLNEIKVPTLFTVGEFDSVGPHLVKSYSEKVADSKYYMFSNAAHLTMWDAKEENIKVVKEFLLSVD